MRRMLTYMVHVQQVFVSVFFRGDVWQITLGEVWLGCKSVCGLGDMLRFLGGQHCCEDIPKGQPSGIASRVECCVRVEALNATLARTCLQCKL
jgi:hypothetical protein